LRHPQALWSFRARRLHDCQRHEAEHRSPVPERA
jgi:hypothetical protein